MTVVAIHLPEVSMASASVVVWLARGHVVVMVVVVVLVREC